MDTTNGASSDALHGAITTYHTLLDTEPALAEASAELLLEAQPAARLTFAGKLLCTVLRPHFLLPATYARIRSVCTTLTAAMFRLAEHMLDDPSLLEPLSLTPAELELISIDPGYHPFTPTTRLDSFMTSDMWRFTEYNAECPAGIAYEDGLSAIFLQLPIIEVFSRTHCVTPLLARDRLRDVLLTAYHQWREHTGGGGALGRAPTIAIVDWEGVPTSPEFELFAEYFRASGLQALIADPRALDYDGEHLYADGQPIDLVYKRVLISELLARPEAAKPLVDAYKAHHVCVVNSFRDKLLHKKSIFALLSDPRYAHHFTEAERALITAHIPWTRCVAEGYSTYNGARIDLVPFILDNRERLVLKPNDEYGGKGVIIGWETTAADWEAALNGALTTPYVVQERVVVERERFPLWEEGRLVWVDLAVDLDPFIFGTEVTGALTRLSASSLLNVTAGRASTTPTFLVERA